MKPSYKEPDLTTATMALIRAANDAPEIGRRALAAYVLCQHNQSMPLITDEEIRESQHSDGGWTNVPETVLFAGLCRLRPVLQDCYDAALSWLRSVRMTDGGWGTSGRDISRIPITGLLLHLLPGFSDKKAANWLNNEWRKDFGGSTRLTYKGACFLLGLRAFSVTASDCPLIKETYSFLAAEQNEDGGFGPWKDHPIGSDPWSTGIVLLGLLSYDDLIDKKVIERAVDWLAETQLPNGLWPYHYIDEGSAYAYWGLVEALKYLSREPG
ncbi:MAG: terpene cyclase/mutase family protein [Deltaproteobacteria bacterium]|nr:terpene cyclase/mutase family protein [Deltaproteobacteria bacterium]